MPQYVFCCPMCGSTKSTRAALEGVRLELGRFVCNACGFTWAERLEPEVDEAFTPERELST